MGIWTDAFVAPAEPYLLSREDFGRLAVDLARERVVRTPWALIAGELCVNASLNWESVSGQARWDGAPVGSVLRSDEVPGRPAAPPPWGPSYERARLIGRGERVLDVLPALQSAPYGDQDVAVVFDHLDFTNRAIRDYFSFEDDRTMLVCFALARPQTRPLSTNDCGPAGGPVHTVRTCIVHTFKHALEDGIVPPIASIATRYFGTSLVGGETWG
ncbi:hypothetical protein [Streptomyces violascens]|uniref:Uncharacterized protein n=1 Tax=Streptomyces violascens TaxID=67381 RepID=A0ABQ3QTB8_9ACTN|nr:hypothetical protein [Streptomyces violascens]GHI40523.1 hypothetical protein Sviol_49310 [Streptomyces violascens]